MRPGGARRAVLGALLALLAAGGAPACAPGADPAGEAALRELERLAFVPPGVGRISSKKFTVLCANPAPLLVDRFEVTRGQWRAWFESGGRAVCGPSLAAAVRGWPDDTDAWPATYMTLAEARAFALARGLRLPTAEEWMRIAAGTRAQPWPWGTTRSTAVANTLTLGLGRPVPVGTFERGATPLGTYDMTGNVWEWVEGRLVPLGEQPASDGLAWVLGGSYSYHERPLFSPGLKDELEFARLGLDPRHRALDVGLRCAVDARTYLARPRPWARAERARERLVAVGRSWGRAAGPLLADLAAEPEASPALAWLLEGARQ